MPQTYLSLPTHPRPIPHTHAHIHISGHTPLISPNEVVAHARTLPPRRLLSPPVPLAPSLLPDFRQHEYLQTAIAYDNRHNVILEGHGVESVLGRRVVELPCRFVFSI